ncbi:M3 family metallopeptidase [Agaribacter marinus]|uniref:oligopeptidase A n=1 Tax=Agaribacter marinus TaxID=1431249 RepID=A0AA37T6G5_9ALTE|nr:M3 family metallopeptidase [Agaribacter marinus]GLR72280.1 peptidase M3 [Agaribacter marinus]
MKKMKFSAIAFAVTLTLSGCSKPEQDSSAETSTTENQAAMSDAVTPNPLLLEFSGPYEGVPAFDKMDLKYLAPALDTGMEKSLVEIESIANNTEDPTFENTIVAMERAGQALNRAFTYYGIWRSNLSSPEFREIQREITPKISEYSSKITQNAKLFKRIETVYKSDAFKALSEEEKRITTARYNNFVGSGATLDEAGKKRFAEINQRLAELHRQFGANVLADEENYVLYLDDSQLDGLPDSFVKAAAGMAERRGEEGKYAVTNSRSSMDPFLTYSTNRDLREKVWNTYYNRSDNGDEYDNNAVIKEILSLRHERVKMLGFDNYAQWRLQDRMAKTPENAMTLMEKVWPAALARVSEEVADMQAIADQEGAGIKIAPWDYRFYAEKVRKAKYALDSNEVKQYLQLDKLRDAMFYVAGRLFNFEFSEVPEGSVPVFHEDVSVWEVKDITSGKLVGLWYLDPFARQGKRSGAWATYYRSYTTYDGETNVLSSNNSNFVKGAPGEATLISWDDAETYFHEFGHALHFLAADVKYPSSHNGVRDYTEFQSQLLERWLLTDDVINSYLVHHKTGEPIPAALVAKIKSAATFNEGFKTTEYMSSAIMDLLYHTTDPATIEPDTFEKEQLDKLGMPSEIVMRHRSPHFQHVFSSEGYAAAYYGYMWAEVLTSDAAEAFAQSPGGYYDKALGDKLVQYLFSVRNAMDPAEAYRQFRGRDAEVEALMRDRGFPVEGE